jgi:uncharacterized protein (DUF1778 family)
MYDKLVQVRMNEEQKKCIVDAAKRHEKSVSSWIRQVAEYDELLAGIDAKLDRIIDLLLMTP